MALAYPGERLNLLSAGDPPLYPGVADGIYQVHIVMPYIKSRESGVVNRE